MKFKDKKIITYLFIVVLSFLTMLTMAMVSGFGITGIDIVLPCLFALCVIVFAKVSSLLEGDSDVCMQSKTDLKFTIPLGIVVSIATVVGSKIDMEVRAFSDFGIVDVVYIILLIPFFISVFELLFFSSDVISRKIGENDVRKSLEENIVSDKVIRIKHIIRDMAIMFVCWLPYYLTYCPGGIGNDIFESVKMCIGEIPWTNHHPVLFTAIMKLFITIFAWDGNISRALAAMVLCQMLLMALVMALSIAWLNRRGLPKKLGWIVLAFISLHPIFPMYSIYLTKDILFAMVIVLLVLFLLDFVELYSRGLTYKDGDKIELNAKVPENSSLKGNCSKKITLYTVLGTLLFGTMITRNNGTLVALLTIAFMLGFMRKIWKQLLIVFVTVLVLNGIYKGPIWSAIGIEKQSFVESAAIPLTQIAYTIYTDGVIEGEDKAYLEAIMPLDIVEKNYEPGYVDSYKFDENFNTSIVDANPGKLIKVWFRLLPKNFGRYVEAYLMETCGYWSYGVSNTLCTEGVWPNDLGIVQSDFVYDLTGVSFSGIISKLMLVVRKLPLLCLLSQMAVEILAVVLVGCQLFRKKNGVLAIALVPLMAIWVSVMIASPAHCLFRYMCPIFFLWPVLLWEFVKGESR